MTNRIASSDFTFLFPLIFILEFIGAAGFIMLGSKVSGELVFHQC